MVILFANIKKRLPKLELLDSLFRFAVGVRLCGVRPNRRLSGWGDVFLPERMNGPVPFFCNCSAVLRDLHFRRRFFIFAV